MRLRFCHWIGMFWGLKTQNIPIGPTLIQYGGKKSKSNAYLFFDAASQYFWRFDPTLSSKNSGLKDSKKNITFSESAGRQLSYGIPWIPQTYFCNREKRVCVCIVLVHYGPFPQKINGKSVHAHFTFFSAQFGHSHFHGSAGLVPRSSFWHCVMNTQALTKLTQSHPLEKRSYRDKK